MDFNSITLVKILQCIFPAPISTLKFCLKYTKLAPWRLYSTLFHSILLGLSNVTCPQRLTCLFILLKLASPLVSAASENRKFSSSYLGPNSWLHSFTLTFIHTLYCIFKQVLCALFFLIFPESDQLFLILLLPPVWRHHHFLPRLLKYSIRSPTPMACFLFFPVWNHQITSVRIDIQIRVIA